MKGEERLVWWSGKRMKGREGRRHSELSTEIDDTGRHAPGIVPIGM